MAQKKKYKDIGKKDLIEVCNQIIRKVEAIEMTLNLLVLFVDKENKFKEFMEETLKPKETGDNNELRPDETDDGKEDNSNSNESS